MTPAELRARSWAAVASVAAQIAATAAGMLPWWGLPLTLALTALVWRPHGPVDPRRSRALRAVGATTVGIFAGLIVFKTVAAGSAGTDPTATLRSLTEALVVLSLVMAPSARTSREHRVWLTVTTGVLVAAAAGGHSATSAALSLASWVILLTAIAKVQAVAAHADGAVLATPVDAELRPVPGRPLGVLNTAVPVAAALLAGTLVFFALPAGLGGGGIATRLAGHVKGDGNGEEDASRASIGVDTFGDGDLSLLLRGSLPDTPILRVPATSPSLWRGTIYTTYTGNSWVVNDGQQFDFTRGDDDAVPPSPIDPPPTGHNRIDLATYAGGFHGALVWSPGVPVHITGLGGSIEGITREPGNTRIIGAEHIASYRVTSTVPTTSPARLRAAGGAGQIASMWTQLPANLPADISQLAHQVTAHASDRYEQVTDLETYLRGHETYSQSSPLPASGDDAVNDFLFRDHSGFCEQFASAEAVMLRTLGVPARVVSGLAYGTRQGKTRLLTASDAHAWVEVYYPGIGWSPSDPTAGSKLAPQTSGHRSRLTRILHGLAADLPGGRTSLLIIVLALFVGAAAAVRAVLRSHSRASAPPRAGLRVGPVLAAFHRLAGHPQAPAPRAAAETAREYLGRIATPGHFAAAVETLEQECYGATPPDPAAVDSAVEAFAGAIGSDSR